MTLKSVTPELPAHARALEKSWAKNFQMCSYRVFLTYCPIMFLSSELTDAEMDYDIAKCYTGTAGARPCAADRGAVIYDLKNRHIRAVPVCAI